MQSEYDLMMSLYEYSDSYIYSISGFFDEPMNSIERFDTHKGTWTEIKGALSIPRTKF